MGGGFLGTRADLVLDLVLVLFVALPFVILFAVRLAARGQHRLHRNVQASSLVAMVLAVIGLELDIRFGGLMAGVEASAFAGTSLLLGVFVVHLLVAVPTLVSWIWLGSRSWFQYSKVLPGTFSGKHVLWGKLTFAGVCMTSVTGLGLYALGYWL